jgi:apolipoprotein D and lipocalin family protein
MFGLIARICAMCTLGLAAGCVVTGPSRDGSYRDQSALIASQVDVSAQDLDGTWHVRQQITGAWPRGAGTVQISADGGALILSEVATACNADNLCEPATFVTRYEPTRHGRFRKIMQGDARSGLNGPDALWVLWMDYDRRTFVAGDPSGSYAAIFDHQPTGGADRIVAARDILVWFGYDISRLEERRR